MESHWFRGNAIYFRLHQTDRLVAQEKWTFFGFPKPPNAQHCYLADFARDSLSSQLV